MQIYLHKYKYNTIYMYVDSWNNPTKGDVNRNNIIQHKTEFTVLVVVSHCYLLYIYYSKIHPNCRCFPT